MVAIETPGKGRLLVFNQPGDVANIVRALSTVATKRQARVEKELGGMSTNDMLREALKMPELRDGVIAELSKMPELREMLRAALGET